MIKVKEKKKVIIAGAGFGGIYSALKLPEERFRVVLVDEKDKFVFTPLLHEVATGSLRPESVQHSIRSFLKKNAEIVQARVETIDLEKKEVTLKHDKGVRREKYDYLIIATGSKANFYGMKIEEEVETLKDIEGALRIREALFKVVRENRKCRVAVIGGGPTGLEVACEIGQLFRNSGKTGTKKVVLIQKGNVLSRECPKIQRIGEEALKKLGIEHVRERVTGITNKTITLENGEKIKADLCIWAAGVKPNSPEIKQNVKEKEYIKVNEQLQIAAPEKTYKDAFAIGDCAITPDKAPMLAQTAEAEAKVCAANIKALENGGRLREFKFKRKGFLVSLGNGMAAADISGLVFKGWFAWWLWRTIYLFKLPGMRNRISVALHWTDMLIKKREI